MQKRRKQFGAMAAVIVSIALLTAPLCSAACANAEVFAALAAQTVEPAGQPHHCHQSSGHQSSGHQSSGHQSSPQPENPTAPPQPGSHSHNCENHQAALLLPGKASPNVPNGVALFQPYLAASDVWWLTGERQVRHKSRRDSLKAPPRAQLRTILRI